MSLENYKENNEEEKRYRKEFQKEDKENTKESRYVKNNIDYSSHGYVEQNEEKSSDKGNEDGINDSEEIDFSSDEDCINILDDCIFENLNSNENTGNLKDSNPLLNLNHPFVEEFPDELEMLGFFNSFTLMELGIHDLIREIYFEE